jgi:hypothetical protein
MEKADVAESASRAKTFHWLIALGLTAWCLLWVVSNGCNYLYLTWRLFRGLRWLSLCLIYNPCAWIWFSLFASTVWVPKSYLILPWCKRNEFEMSRTRIFLMVFFVPPILGLLLHYLGPYFYPVIYGGDDGTRIFLRLIPFVGGKGYD